MNGLTKFIRAAAQAAATFERNPAGAKVLRHVMLCGMAVVALGVAGMALKVLG